MSHGGPTRRTCVLIDLEGYSALNAVQQHVAQRELAAALAHAARKAGLNRPSWHRQETGDGELAVLPDEESQAAVVADFPTALDAQLRHRSDRHGVGLRARLAMVYGVATPAELGHSGHAVVEVARIADAPPVRRALAGVPDSHLVLALSPELYRDVIGSRTMPIGRDDFRRVRIDRTGSQAWIALPGIDPERIPLDPEEVADRTEVVQIVISDELTVAAARDVNVAAVGRDSTGYQTNIAGSVTTDYFHIGPRRG